MTDQDEAIRLLRGLLIESQDSIGGDWRARRDNAIAATANVQPVTAQEPVNGVQTFWLVELRPAFEGHPAFAPTYYAGWMESALEAAKTTDVHAAPKFTSKEDARRVAERLGHTLSCTWEAVEHGFHGWPTPPAAHTDTPPAVAEGVDTALDLSTENWSGVFHTAFRHAGNSQQAAAAHAAIEKMDASEWGDIVDYMLHGIRARTTTYGAQQREAGRREGREELRKLTMQYKREADALWKRVHEAEALATKPAEGLTDTGRLDHLFSALPARSFCEALDIKLPASTLPRPLNDWARAELDRAILAQQAKEGNTP